jgi:redox-sensitive bicupin YhaK (pirin superfamily)
VQWLTAGGGIVHAEMFPLLERERENPAELFQIWLNLPSEDKLVAPHFSMLWNEKIPRHLVRDSEGRASEITVVAGALDGVRALAPPPKSWASRADSNVAIWTLKMAPGAHFTLPAAPPGTNRVLYFFAGNTLQVGDETVSGPHALQLRADAEAPLANGSVESELLLLQGRPIGEPIAQYGPFVMNTRAEIQAAFSDYQRTGFGGWPWKSDDPVHPREATRFARHSDGHVEKP